MTRLGRSYPVNRVFAPRKKLVAATGPVYDATGAGNHDFAGVNTSMSWSHTAAAGAYALAFPTMVGGTATSVTYGGTAMTQLGSVTDGLGAAIQYVYGLAGVAGGAQTVTVNASAASDFVGNSVSFTGVSSAGTPTSTTDVSGAISQSVTCTTGQVIAQSFAELYGVAGLSQPGLSSPTGGTLRWSTASMTLSTAIASTTFTATDDYYTTGIAAVLS